MKTLPPNNRAFSLVEITVALGIISFCLLAIFGLLPVGISSNQSSVEQSGAANIATNIVADLRATEKPPKNTSKQFQIDIPDGTAANHTLFFRKDGKMVGSIDTPATPVSEPFYRAYLDIKKDPVGPATLVRVLITWPALGDSATGGAPKNFRSSFETVVALDRS